VLRAGRQAAARCSLLSFAIAARRP
jgi:hypothetical protein